MKNALKHNFSKFILIGKIKRLKEEAVWNLASRKRVVGIDIRHYLLAYAFLKGDSYHNVDKTCAKDNLPRADVIYKLMEVHAPKWIPSIGSYNPTLNDVQVWLSGAV